MRFEVAAHVTGPGILAGEAATEGGDIDLTTAVDRLEAWLRCEFVDRNTRLEEAYFSAGREVLCDRPDLDELKWAIVHDGARLIAPIGAPGTIPAGTGERYRLLGAVGFYLAACRRHEADGTGDRLDSPLAPAWALASRLGSSLGVAPRFVFAHQSIYNPAVGGVYRLFTNLEDEVVFVTNNALSVLAYQRAAHALRSVLPMGPSSPVAAYLFEGARAALDDVLHFNRTLGGALHADRFFFNIRPYYKPHLVGEVEYRGANAGDFAAVNEIDLLLGLCQADDPFYQHVVTEKYAYVPPGDQVLLRQAVGRQSLLDRFLAEAQAEAGAVSAHLRHNAGLFLAVCRSHGAAYSYHHQQLVKPFLEEPAKASPADRQEAMTASGPPLEVVVESLARLRDLRLARDRPGASSARAALDRLRHLTATPA
ncbi:MAG: monodechloroaminopyrrolnitrin synthase PrnB family protein [Acidimicrobiia bacterium]